MHAYTNTTFTGLLNKYPTWESMKAFLTSPEGGNLTCKERAGSPYAVVYAKKGVADMNVAHAKWFRSVVWNMEKHRPVSVMTQKAELDDPLAWDAATAAERFGSKDTLISTYEDGITLTVFKDAGSEGIQVATRSQLGAGGKFFKSATKSFAGMLEDAIRNVGGVEVGAEMKYLEDALGAEELPVQEGDVSRFMSVLVQHPEHRVVKAVTDGGCAVFLQKGVVRADGTIDMGECVPVAEQPLATGQTVSTWFEAVAAGRDWSWQGIMIHDQAGRRWRIRSPVYQMIRSLRGNTGRADERFFGLRGSGLVKTYLIYYPEDSAVFWECEQWLRKATGDLMKYYSDVYKLHTKTIEEVPGEWQAHVQAIHRVYRNELRPNGKSVTMKVAVDYMNSQPTPRLLYLMNLHHRVAQGKKIGGGRAKVIATSATTVPEEMEIVAETEPATTSS